MIKIILSLRIQVKVSLEIVIRRVILLQVNLNRKFPEKRGRIQQREIDQNQETKGKIMTEDQGRNRGARVEKKKKEIEIVKERIKIEEKEANQKEVEAERKVETIRSIRKKRSVKMNIKKIIIKTTRKTNQLLRRKKVRKRKNLG